MGAQNKKKTNNIVEALELPKDVVLGLPLVNLCGNGELYIDNHLGIVRFEPEHVTVRTKPFLIEIEGRGLCVDYYTRDSIKLIGQMKSICFVP